MVYIYHLWNFLEKKKEYDIEHQMTIRYNLQQNKIVERKKNHGHNEVYVALKTNA